MIIVGKISAKAILKYQRRECKQVYLRKKKNIDKDAAYIERLAKEKGISVTWESDDALNKRAGVTTHGGVVLECGPRISDSLKALATCRKIMCIEGVSDPYNMGEICRTVCALGFDGVLTNTYDYYEHEAKLVRASAGASESLIWHQSDDVSHALNELRSAGVVVVGAHRDDKSQSLLNYTFPDKVCICIGGALRGLSRSVLDACDTTVRIDYDARVSLSTVGAVSAFAYAVYSQKEKVQ